MSISFSSNIIELLKSIATPIWVFEPCTYATELTNKSFNQLINNSENEIEETAKYFFSKLPHKEEVKFRESVENAKIEGSANIELVLNLIDGGVYFLSLSSIKDSVAGNNLVICILNKEKHNDVSTIAGLVENNFILSVFDKIRDVFFVLDCSGTFVFANKIFSEFLSEREDSIIGKSVWDVFPNARGRLLEEYFQKSIYEKESKKFEEYFPSFDKWFSILMLPSDNLLSVFVYDISKSKIREDLLLESEKKFHLISDNSPMFIWTMNESDQPTFFNKNFITFSGWTNEILMKCGWLELVHPDERQEIGEEWVLGLRTKSLMNFEVRIRRYDGVYRWIKMNCSPQFDNNGIFSGFLGNGVDITDLKFYHQKLEEKNLELATALNESRRLSEILNKTSNILVLTDVNGNITWVNEAFTKYTEYTFEEVVGKKPGPLVYGEETSLETMQILHEGIQKREITRVEILNYSKSGNKFWLDLRIEPIFKDGEPEGYIAIEIDITKRKKDELALKERNDKIKEFSFITSHYLRHEFAKIMMLLNLAKSKDNSVEDYDSLFNHLEEPVTRINGIISKLNSNLLLSDVNESLNDKIQDMDELIEICFIDDDELTNMIHKQIIKIILPQIPVRVYENVDVALNYFKIQPHNKRLIFLDLVFQSEKSGWDFLNEYSRLNLTAPIIILSSSIDNDDLEKSKQYNVVLEYLVKPLTAENLHKYLKNVKVS